jgi:uncharacterized protein (TIGR02678 family)
MQLLECLLDRRFILKSSDKDLYYRVRDKMGELRRFATEKLGCQIIENSLLVKLEKIPAKADPSMGIREFTTNWEYALFCVLLMFLEDKEPEDQFILSELTEYLSSNMPEGNVDWTLYLQRRQLVKVLRYSIAQGILKRSDGSEDGFAEVGGEVLYENTGVSRYFMRNFSKDIMGYEIPEDFAQSDWYDMEEDRGVIRRHRVYKKLLFSPGMYMELQGTDEDFEYLKRYGRRLAEDLEGAIDGTLHIYKSSAYFLLSESTHMKNCFPGSNMLSDIVLLCCGEIRRQADDGKLKPGVGERITVDHITFEHILKQVKETWGKGFTKEYREMGEREYYRIVTAEMTYWGMIRSNPLLAEIQIMPAVGQMSGYYPGQVSGKGKEAHV